MKMRVFIGIIFIVSIGLIGCQGSSETTHASLPESFTSVSKDGIGEATIYKIKDQVTGCYFILSDSKYNGSSVSQNITQMFIQEHGVSVPYCE
ncbi:MULTISPECIES: hypothetical protein [unclassified Psychrobacillus]|uniref:hypothetical protein n=1 Tax=unclassified Psychrobacillus TaxID=2636677 RepID=UPI0030F9ED58